jgi:hypothetical protein
MGRARSTNGEVKGPLGRLRCRWADNMKMNLREIGWGGVDWIDLAQDMHNSYTRACACVLLILFSLLASWNNSQER